LVIVPLATPFVAAGKIKLMLSVKKDTLNLGGMELFLYWANKKVMGILKKLFNAIINRDKPDKAL
jgi:hypothetical protein